MPVSPCFSGTWIVAVLWYLYSAELLFCWILVSRLFCFCTGLLKSESDPNLPLCHYFFLGCYNVRWWFITAQPRQYCTVGIPFLPFLWGSLFWMGIAVACLLIWISSVNIFVYVGLQSTGVGLVLVFFRIFRSVWLGYTRVQSNFIFF